MTRSTRPRPRVAVHDDTLRPPYASHRGDTPRNIVLAVLCKAYASEITRTDARAWLQTQDNLDVRALARDAAKFHRLYKAAVAKVERSSDPVARRREAEAIAKILVGHLLSPVPPGRGVTKRSEPLARQTLAVVGTRLLRLHRERGFDSALVSAAWLAVRLGVGRDTAARALRTCVQAGWLRQRGTGRNRAGKYKIRRLPALSTPVSWEHYDAVDALVDPAAYDPVAETILVADHPAVGYDLGVRPWLVGLADEAGVNPADLGLARQTAPGYRRTWVAVIAATARETDSLLDALTLHAERTGADVAARNVERARREAAKDRVSDIEQARARKTQVHEALDLMLADHPIPARTAPAPERDAWINALAATFASSGLPYTHRTVFAKALSKRMQTAKYPAQVADAAGQFVTTSPDADEAA